MFRRLIGLVCDLLAASAASAASSSADLEVLQVRATANEAMLTPAFAPDRVNDDVKVGSDITSLQIRAGAWVSASKVTVNEAPLPYLGGYRGALSVGANDFRVAVTATDGQTRKTYTVHVQREDIRPVADAFSKASWTDPKTGLSLPYRLFVPASLEPSKRYPLVLFLHGGGENGSDNDEQLYGTEGATFGTWNVLLARPDLFAAGVAIAGGGDPAQMARLVNMPIWAFHGVDDPVVPVHYSRDSIAALRALGGQPRYTELPSGTFFDPYEHFSWVNAYADPALRDWLFQQRRP